MKERAVVANPYNKEHIELIKKYENNYGVENTTSKYLTEICSMMTEIDYRQLEQERPEITQTLFLSDGKQILTMAHLMGEKDRKVCKITIDNTGSPAWQESLLKQTEDYAFTTLGMEEIILLQEDGRQFSKNTLEKHGFDDLGKELGMQVYTKSRMAEKTTTYQM